MIRIRYKKKKIIHLSKLSKTFKQIFKRKNKRKRNQNPLT